VFRALSPALFPLRLKGSGVILRPALREKQRSHCAPATYTAALLERQSSEIGQGGSNSGGDSGRQTHVLEQLGEARIAAERIEPLVARYWIRQVKSMGEPLEWVRCCPIRCQERGVRDRDPSDRWPVRLREPCGRVARLDYRSCRAGSFVSRFVEQRMTHQACG